MTRQSWLALASRCGALALFCAAALDCRKQTARVDDGAATDGRAGPVNTNASSALPVDAGGLVPATRRSCRVMALSGIATAMPRFAEAATKGDAREHNFTTDADPGAAAESKSRRSLARGDLLPEGWLIELGPDTQLTVQATVSTREITLVGPAIAEACPGGDEEVRLARGKVTAFPGAGVRPGADVWIATPLGVVRFSDAQIDIVVAADDGAARLEVAVVSGQASVVPAAGVTIAPPGAPATAAPRAATAGEKDGSADGDVIALAPGSEFEARRREGPLARWVSDLVAACVRQAGAAREAGRLVGSPEGGRAALGDLAFAHVRARQRARAACEAAWAAGALAPGLLDAKERVDLESAEATWKGAPAPPPHP